MAEPLPAPVRRLLEAADPAARDSAWTVFLRVYTPLLMHGARLVARDRDGVMDTYTHVLDELRADDCRRLRAFKEEGRGKFTTWLTVVVRRLSVDHHRHRYGRVRGEDDDAVQSRAARRRLADLVGADVDLESVPAAQPATDAAVEVAERSTALWRALNGLPAPDRLLVRLRFEDDVSVSEIGRLMRFPTVFHVYRALGRVTQTLREQLERDGISGREP